MLESLFNKVTGLRAETPARVFPVKFAKSFLKLVSDIFIKFLFFHEMIALKNYEKCFLLHQKALFVLEIIKFFYFCPSLFFTLSAIALEDDPRSILKFMTPSVV